MRNLIEGEEDHGIDDQNNKEDISFSSNNNRITVQNKLTNFETLEMTTNQNLTQTKQNITHVNEGDQDLTQNPIIQ